MKTEEQSPRMNEAGAIGIGAMIVFIALILVAAVASAVIIQTAEKLQQNAQQTGDDTTQEIGGKITITSAILQTVDTNDDYGIRVIFEASAGSETLDLNTADNIQYHIICTSANGGFNAGTGELAEVQGDFSAAVNANDQTAALDTMNPGTVGMLDIDIYTDSGSAGTTTGDSGCKADTGFEHTLYIHVKNGGSTYETLKYGSISVGEAVV